MTTGVALLLVAAAVQAPPVFRGKIEIVRVDVLVERDGVPVSGLTAADFEVFDNGVRQAVELAMWEQTPSHAILALDTSASVSGEKFRQLEAAARAFLGGLKPADRATVLTFSHVVRLVSGVGAPPGLALRAFPDGHPQGSTALFDAAYSALSLADASLGRNFVVLFSDGKDRLSWLSPGKLIEAAEASAAVVYVILPTGDEPPPERQPEVGGRTVVHLGSDPDAVSRLALSELATKTGGRVWHAGRGSGLESAFQRVLGEVRSRYVLSYEPKGVEPGGWHRLQVRVTRVKGQVYTRKGYFASVQ